MQQTAWHRGNISQATLSVRNIETNFTEPCVFWSSSATAWKLPGFRQRNYRLCAGSETPTQTRRADGWRRAGSGPGLVAGGVRERWSPQTHGDGPRVDGRTAVTAQEQVPASGGAAGRALTCPHPQPSPSGCASALPPPGPSCRGFLPSRQCSDWRRRGRAQLVTALLPCGTVPRASGRRCAQHLAFWLEAAPDSWCHGLDP